MATFDAGGLTNDFFYNQQFYDFAPATVAGWSYVGTSAGDTIIGANYAYQTRFHGGYHVTDYVYGNDNLSGAAGDDNIDGGQGNDTISGGDGIDHILGSDGNDAINGNIGNDAIGGGNGSDTIRGGQNNDGIEGNAGDDFISGDAGNDALAGGIGADTFNFSLGFGNDIIQDFNRSEGDSVLIEAGTYSLAQVGANTIVTMSDSSTITLWNVNYSSLDSGWIHN